jgi:hypothetical protein
MIDLVVIGATAFGFIVGLAVGVRWTSQRYQRTLLAYTRGTTPRTR